ncbi:MAG: CpsD/CapB family tyrosine-protein kinase [Lactobacillales bacterium]|nr:CpsD/CapB family tyrosine-protein kinase [Lactobacillales bacterium]
MFKRNKYNSQTKPVSLITVSEKRNTVSEQYRTIRSNIRFSMVDRDLKTLVVTSAGPSEGKSTTANNLAVVFADAGIRTLLVDADLRKPTVGLTWNLPNNHGLSDLLRDRTARFSDYIQETSVERLSVLTSGPQPPNPSELLGTNRMNEVIHDLSTKFDLVIFDTPPVATVTDAQILASRTDGTILVVRERQTDKVELETSKQLLEMAKANIVGVVFNGTKGAQGGYYYEYNSKSQDQTE